MRIPSAAKPAAPIDSSHRRLIRGSFFSRLPAERRASMIEEALAKQFEELMRSGEMLLADRSSAGISI